MNTKVTAFYSLSPEAARISKHNEDGTATEAFKTWKDSDVFTFWG